MVTLLVSGSLRGRRIKSIARLLQNLYDRCIDHGSVDPYVWLIMDGGDDWVGSCEGVMAKVAARRPGAPFEVKALLCGPDEETARFWPGLVKPGWADIRYGGLSG
jgi:hypothetical protein